MIIPLVFSFIILFGLITSFEDIFSGKIRNKWVLSAFLFGLTFFIVDYFFIQSGLSFMPSTFPSVWEYWINIGSSVIVGLLIWYSGLWSSGDAKLFMAYSFLVPLRYYFVGYTLHFPAITLLINTFTPFLIVVIFYLLFKNNIKTHFQVLKFAFGPKLVATIILFVFGFEWILTLFFKMVGIPSNLFFVILLLYLIIIFATKYLKFNFFVLVGVLSVLRLIFDWQGILSMHFLTTLIVTSLVLIFFRFYLITLAYHVFSYPVYIEKLKEGMLPAEDIIKEDEKKFIKKKHIQLSFIQALLSKTDKSILGSLPDGLTNEDISLIQMLHSRGSLKEHTLNIYNSLPFAPFMFLGVLLTLICGGNCILYLISLI
jgi:hypothetical protein